jgi:hypothetical protein
METEGSLPSSQELSTCTYPEPDQSSDPFRNEFVFYGEGLLAPSPTPKLEDHPLSFVRDCLFNIFAANLQLEAVPTIRNPRTRNAVVTRGPT